MSAEGRLAVDCDENFSVNPITNNKVTPSALPSPAQRLLEWHHLSIAQLESELAPWMAAPLFHRQAVGLRRLTAESIADLRRLGIDPQIWRHSRFTKNDPAKFDRYFDKVLADSNSLRFAVWHFGAERVVGFTRLKKLDWISREAETGTWLGGEFQRQGFNRAIKLQLLYLAFQCLSLKRVYCYVNHSNTPSQISLQRCGFSEVKLGSRQMKCETGDMTAQACWQINATDFFHQYSDTLKQWNSEPSME